MDPLTAEEVRVAGCLAEKAVTVPETYPLTLNALRAACNQSSSRDPVVAYDDRTVLDALDGLKAKRLVRFVHPSHGGRTIRYRHVLDDALGLGPDELALLTVLMLRGPQTAGELRQRTERLYPFASIADLEATLRSLAGREPPLAALVGRRPGQKDDRWTHLLGAAPSSGAVPPTGTGAGQAVAGPPAGATPDPGEAVEWGSSPSPDVGVGSARSEARLEELAAEVARLRRLVEHLYAAMGEEPPAEA